VWNDIYAEEPAMFINFTAKHTKIPAGYLGQLIAWPEVVNEGRDLEDCRALLREGGNHAIYTNGLQTIPVKRHNLMDRITAN